MGASGTEAAPRLLRGPAWGGRRPSKGPAFGAVATGAVESILCGYGSADPTYDVERLGVIEEIAGMPDGVDGFRLVGEITKADYDAVLTPWVNEIADSGRDVRAVIVIGDDFTGYETGAAWEDTKLGLRMETHHRTLWKRVALVTETGWVKRLVALFGWMVPGEVRIFGLGEVEDAKEWAAQD